MIGINGIGWDGMICYVWYGMYGYHVCGIYDALICEYFCWLAGWEHVVANYDDDGNLLMMMG